VHPPHWNVLCKLTDFGLSFCLDSKSHLSNLHVGTPFYLAPEARLGVGGVLVSAWNLQTPRALFRRTVGQHATPLSWC